MLRSSLVTLIVKLTVPHSEILSLMLQLLQNLRRLASPPIAAVGAALIQPDVDVGDGVDGDSQLS